MKTEEQIQNFYVTLEETRREFLDLQSRSSESLEATDACILREACQFMYVRVENLWESVPLSYHQQSEAKEGNEQQEDVWSAVVMNCTLKVF